MPEGNYATAHVVFYASVALMVVAWLGLGVLARGGELTVGRAWITLASWGTPLFVGAPLFGRDVYSYIAQGELVRGGHNPYTTTPAALGNGTLLSSVATVWHHTTSPYGPLFVEVTKITTSLSGHSLMVQVVAFRIVMLVGVILLMQFIPLIARHMGVDCGVALWLAVLSPLALFSAISSAHNDTLMLGIVAAALWLQLRGQWRWAVVLFALGAALKLPALAGTVLLVAGEWRSVSWRRRVHLIAESAALTVGVLAGVTAVVGYGWAWLGPKALSIPTQLHVLTSPTVSVGLLLATLVHVLGIHHSARAVVVISQHLGELLAVVTVMVTVVHTRHANAVRHLGIALLIVVILSPTVWPWYFLWGVTVLALTSAQRSKFLAAIGALAMLLVGPGGTPMVGGNGFYAFGVILLAAGGWFILSGQWRNVLRTADRGN